MTEAQKRFCDEYIDFYDNRVFVTENYSIVPYYKELIINSLALLLGDYDPFRKRAALLLLKAYLRSDFRKLLLEDCKLYPISRSDSRVAKWAKEVKKLGHCELCNSKKNLHAHHIVSWAEYPQGRIDIKNGMCLCAKCHAYMHRFDKYSKLIEKTAKE